MLEKVLVLGASGMLGHKIFEVFSKSYDIETWGTVRYHSAKRFQLNASHIIEGVDVLDQDQLQRVLIKIRPTVVINCVGLIKHLVTGRDPLMAIPINSIFPHRLSNLCKLINARLLLISTDCVFSGSKGNYSENDIPDGHDLYGRSKILGEIADQDHVFTLRTSIIGHELNSNKSLVDWFLTQNNSVKGYSKAIFSGFPTVVLAKILLQYVIPHKNLSGLYHISAEPINKFELLKLIEMYIRNR
jgi:dTDP-4-dehydrorhamnose reductase